MPRIRRGVEDAPRPTSGNLADELRANRESGQTVVDEQEFANGKLRVNVVWDAWDRLPLEDRTAVVHRAYELAEGREYARRIALASGLTFPEAHAAGMLPFEVIPALRKTDPVTPEQCRQAMFDEGASILLDPDRPQLRFATERQSQDAVERLAKRLPGSEPVWAVVQEVGHLTDWSDVT